MKKCLFTGGLGKLCSTDKFGCFTYQFRRCEHKKRSNSTMSKRRAEAIGAVAKEEQK
jgi:hypothetical protein